MQSLYIILGIIIYKTPKYMDKFYIRQESQLHLVFFLGIFCVYTYYVFEKQTLPKEYKSIILSISTVVIIYILNGIFMVSKLSD